MRSTNALRLADLWIIARTGVLLAMSGAFLITAVLGLFVNPVPAQPQAYVNPIEYEHRVTSIETQVGQLATSLVVITAQMNDLKNTRWLEMIALSGLLGETGLRTLRTRVTRKKEED